MNAADPAVGTEARSATVLTRLRTWDWLYLAYLAYPLAQPLFEPHPSRWEWGLAIGICVATTAMFAAAVFAPARTLWWCLVPMTVLGALTTPVNAGASVLFIYAAASAGGSRPRSEALRWFAGLTALVLVTFAVSQVPMPYRWWGLLPALALVWIIGVIQVKNRGQQQEAENLRLRNARIELLATIAERERIARDLHDLLGHSLTAVVLRAQLTKELALVDPHRARAEAEEIERNAREALRAVRGTVTGWRQATIGTELEAARNALAGTGVDLRVSCEESLILLGSTEHELALALREAVTNVARHAQASTCRIALDRSGDSLRLVIADDGVGGTAPEGTGLTGLRERITALGGQVRRTSAAGTTVTITVPLTVDT